MEIPLVIVAWPWFPKVKHLNLVSSVLRTQRTVILEFGTRKSHRQLFGLQMGPWMIVRHLNSEQHRKPCSQTAWQGCVVHNNTRKTSTESSGIAFGFREPCGKRWEWNKLRILSVAKLWLPFRYNILPGMKLGRNLRTGMEWRMKAWKSPNDPSPGIFYWGILLYNYPEYYLMKGTEKFVRIGPWNGLHFSGIPDQKPNSIYDYNYISNNDEIYYTFSLKNEAVISRLVMNQTSSMSFRYVWMEDGQYWKFYKSLPKDNCDFYGICGVYGTCTITGSQICQCLSILVLLKYKVWKMFEKLYPVH